MKGHKAFASALVLWLCLASAAMAQTSTSLTEAQYDQLQTDIAATPALSGLSDQAIAEYYNAPSTPAFWVWRARVTEQEVYESTVEGAKWSWPTFKAQTAQDRDSWVTMWHPGQVNPSLQQTRDGWLAIFGGQGASLTQVNYLLALSRRACNRIEKLLADISQGAGTTAAPALLTFVGTLSARDVAHALRDVPLQ
jgi:hypothetical protein